MKKSVIAEINAPERPLNDTHFSEANTSEATYVWTCFNGIKLFIPYSSITHFPLKIRGRKIRLNSQQFNHLL